MSHVFKTQSLLTISVETDYASLAAASTKLINYTKPQGQTGSFTATASGTTLTYALANGDIDQAGLWKFQAYIVVGGLKGIGSIDTHFFEAPLL